MLNDNYPRLINSVTGWNLSLEDVERIGERIWNLERAFNVREGVRRSQDVLPYRVMYDRCRGDAQGHVLPTGRTECHAGCLLRPARLDV